MPLINGQIFAGYTIIRLLGAGGMGEVYLAQHPRLPRRDALKLLPREWSAAAEYRARFNREADLASTLWHPHIVGVHDRGEEDGQLWISMDYVDGLDAARLLTNRYPVGMPAEEVSRIVTAVASALDYAHKQGLLHRDVKPANIMITHLDNVDEQRVLLTDFGIARDVHDISGLTKTNMTVGTVAYASPEQLLGEDVDGRADQYSLAATAYHLLTGSQLFPNSNPAVVISHHLNMPPPALGEVRPELAPLDPVLAIALAKNPDHRFRQCRDFANALALARIQARIGDVDQAATLLGIDTKKALASATPEAGEKKSAASPKPTTGQKSPPASRPTGAGAIKPEPLAMQAVSSDAQREGQEHGSQDRGRRGWLPQVLVGVAVLLLVALLIAMVRLAMSSSGGGSTATATSVRPASPTSAAPSTAVALPTTSEGITTSEIPGRDYTIADYIKDKRITETPIHHGDPGPNVDLPIPAGWQINQNAQSSYGGIVLAQPANPADPPTITALYSKLTGNVDPAKIIHYAPNEILGLPGYQGTGKGQASALSGFQAWQLSATYQRDGKTRAVAQKTVVIPSHGAVFVLQLNADALQSDQGTLMDATTIVDDQATITP